jgi:outer membrane protein assembly factor BamB
VSDGIVYTYGPHALSALQASDGALLWTHPTTAQWFGAPLAVGNVIIGDADNNKTYALDAKTGQERWNALTRGSPRARMASWNDAVFVGGMDHVAALNVRDGAVKWSADVGDIVQSPLLVG